VVVVRVGRRVGCLADAGTCRARAGSSRPGPGPGDGRWWPAHRHQQCGGGVADLQLIEAAQRGRFGWVNRLSADESRESVLGGILRAEEYANREFSRVIRRSLEGLPTLVPATG
jgi:hypothetical protein